MKTVQASIAVVAGAFVLLAVWLAMLIAIFVGWPILTLRRWLRSNDDAADTRWPSGF